MDPRLGASWGRLGGVLGAFWVLLRRLGRPGSVLAPLGASWCLGGVLEHPGERLGTSWGSVLERPGGVLQRPGGVLGPSWSRPGAVLGALGRLGTVLGAS